MPHWIRSRIIRLLFNLVDTAEGLPTEGDAEQWLADNWGHPGFRSYIGQRDVILKHHLAGGDQLVAPEHRKVWQMTGQRVELLKLGHRAKVAFEKREREKAARSSKHLIKRRSR